MNKRSMHGKRAGLLAVLLSLLCLCACGQADETGTDYALAFRWAYYETETDAEKPVDVFFIAPTNVQGGENEFYVDNLDDAQALEAILGSINMEKGIYDAQARFFAPYYRQLTLNAYTLDEAERLAYQDAAWQDVQDAFAYYLEHENNGRPFLIAGFSRGAELGLRLLKQYGGDAAFQEQLVAAYLIGWRVTAEDLAACPSLKMAQGEEDTGVIICFECEAESVTDTLVVPEGTFTYAINPLNWKTDSTPAAKEENLGFVYPGYDGSILEEIPQLCGAYLDPQRGTLKVTDIQPSEYPPVLDIFPEGSYHIYDYEFFYRNLQQNVSVRIQAYERARGAQ